MRVVNVFFADSSLAHLCLGANPPESSDAADLSQMQEDFTDILDVLAECIWANWSDANYDSKPPKLYSSVKNRIQKLASPGASLAVFLNMLPKLVSHLPTEEAIVHIGAATSRQCSSESLLVAKLRTSVLDSLDLPADHIATLNETKLPFASRIVRVFGASSLASLAEDLAYLPAEESLLFTQSFVLHVVLYLLPRWGVMDGVALSPLELQHLPSGYSPEPSTPPAKGSVKALYQTPRSELLMRGNLTGPPAAAEPPPSEKIPPPTGECPISISEHFDSLSINPRLPSYHGPVGGDAPAVMPPTGRNLYGNTPIERAFANGLPANQVRTYSPGGEVSTSPFHRQPATAMPVFDLTEHVAHGLCSQDTIVEMHLPWVRPYLTPQVLQVFDQARRRTSVPLGVEQDLRTHVEPRYSTGDLLFSITGVPYVYKQPNELTGSAFRNLLNGDASSTHGTVFLFNPDNNAWLESVSELSTRHLYWPTNVAQVFTLLKEQVRLAHKGLFLVQWFSSSSTNHGSVTTYDIAQSMVRLEHSLRAICGHVLGSESDPVQWNLHPNSVFEQTKFLLFFRLHFNRVMFCGDIDEFFTKIPEKYALFHFYNLAAPLHEKYAIYRGCIEYRGTYKCEFCGMTGNSLFCSRSCATSSAHFGSHNTVSSATSSLSPTDTSAYNTAKDTAGRDAKAAAMAAAPPGTSKDRLEHLGKTAMVSAKGKFLTPAKWALANNRTTTPAGGGHLSDRIKRLLEHQGGVREPPERVSFRGGF